MPSMGNVHADETKNKRNKNMKTAQDKTRHTNGPWHITKEKKYHTMGTLITVRDSRDGVIAGTHVNDKANAHLIAAAPDMLDALREMLSMFEDHEQYDDDSAQVIAQTRQVIAKAEGGDA